MEGIRASITNAWNNFTSFVSGKSGKVDIPSSSKTEKKPRTEGTQKNNEVPKDATETAVRTLGKNNNGISKVLIFLRLKSKQPSIVAPPVGMTKKEKDAFSGGVKGIILGYKNKDKNMLEGRELPIFIKNTPGQRGNELFAGLVGCAIAEHLSPGKIEGISDKSKELLDNMINQLNVTYPSPSEDDKEAMIEHLLNTFAPKEEQKSTGASPVSSTSAPIPKGSVEDEVKSITELLVQKKGAEKTPDAHKAMARVIIDYKKGNNELMTAGGPQSQALYSKYFTHLKESNPDRGADIEVLVDVLLQKGTTDQKQLEEDRRASETDFKEGIAVAIPTAKAQGAFYAEGLIKQDFEKYQKKPGDIRERFQSEGPIAFQQNKNINNSKFDRKNVYDVVASSEEGQSKEDQALQKEYMQAGEDFFNEIDKALIEYKDSLQEGSATPEGALKYLREKKLISE